MAQKPFVDIRLGPLLPQLGGMPSADRPGYLVIADGVMPSLEGYRPIPIFANVGSATVGTVPGRIYATDINGTMNVFACSASFGPTNTRIQQTANTGTAWSDIEGASGAPGLWADFCEFDNLLICGSRATAPQQKDLFASTATALANLAGSPPTGATFARVRDHVVIGNLTTDDISKSAVRWPAIGDPEDWPTPGTADARAKEAGIQYLPRHLGQVTKVVGGEKFGLVFQERGVTRMTYVGGRAVYEFDTFERKIGTGTTFNDSANTVLIPHPIVDGGNIFYWANDLAQGVFATDGYNVRRVIDRLLVIPQHNSAAFDPYSGLVCFPGVDDSDNILLYKPSTGEYSYADDSTSPFSICELTTAIAATGTINILNLSVAAVTLQRKTSGTEETVEIQTGYIELDPGYRFQFQGAELIGVNTPQSLTLSAKVASDYENVGTSSAGFTSLTEQALSKQHSARLEGRFIAFRITGAPALTTDIFHSLRVYFTRTSPI